MVTVEHKIVIAERSFPCSNVTPCVTDLYDGIYEFKVLYIDASYETVSTALSSGTQYGHVTITTTSEPTRDENNMLTVDSGWNMQNTVTVDTKTEDLSEYCIVDRINRVGTDKVMVFTRKLTEVETLRKALEDLMLAYAEGV
jgi:hypothetical protein